MQLQNSSGARIAKAKVEVRPWKPGHYGKGSVDLSDGRTVLTWRTRGGWDGHPHHDDVKNALGLGHKVEKAGNSHPSVDFHIARNGDFFFHQTGPGRIHPHNPAKMAKIVSRAHPDLAWGGLSAEKVEADPDDPRLG